MAAPLMFKKYSNRRIYDTRNSCYVTLEDVANMIRDGEQVQIQDATSGEDVTAFVLTQIVLEVAKRRKSMLPTPVLHLIIRYGENALADFFETYFQKTIENYINTKEAFNQQFSQWLDMSQSMPGMMPGKSTVENMMEMFGFPKPPTPQEKAPNSTTENDSETKS